MPLPGRIGAAKAEYLAGYARLHDDRGVNGRLNHGTWVIPVSVRLVVNWVSKRPRKAIEAHVNVVASKTKQIQPFVAKITRNYD